jgi:hypothetical protein
LTNDQLVVFRLHDDEDGVNDDAHPAEACGAEPENAGPDFAFVKAVQAQVTEQNAEGEGYPFVVFTLCGHSCTSFLEVLFADRKNLAKYGFYVAIFFLLV